MKLGKNKGFFSKLPPSFSLLYRQDDNLNIIFTFMYYILYATYIYLERKKPTLSDVLNFVSLLQINSRIPSKMKANLYECFFCSNTDYYFVFLKKGIVFIFILNENLL